MRHFEDTALAVDEVTRALEALGHIDLGRSPRTLRVQQWQTAPRCLAETTAGSWVAVGAWHAAALRQAAATAREHGARVETDQDDVLPTWRLVDATADTARAVADACQATPVAQAGTTLLGLLRPLSQVVQALPRVDATGLHSAEWFRVSDASWVPVESVDQPGAYRATRSFTSTYYVRTSLDVENRTAAVATSQLAKHAVATTRPLLGYDPDTCTLHVPLGADLPGLYGRAVTLLSGRPPLRVDNHPLLAYRDVPPTAAGRLHALLRG